MLRISQLGFLPAAATLLAVLASTVTHAQTIKDLSDKPNNADVPHHSESHAGSL
jgi:hypothetical protein